MKSNFFVDIHCHPSLKAFARSFRENPGQQSADLGSDSSMWYRDAPSLFDKVKQYTFGLTNFVQSDASSLMQGRVGVVCLSFYPQEKGFVVNKAGTGIVADALVKLATEYGQERIDHVQAMNSYWDDMKKEMEFVKQGIGKTVVLDGQKVTYYVATSYNQIDELDLEGTLGGTEIIFVPTIEGGHVFDQVMDCKIPWDENPDGFSREKLAVVLQRISDLRMARNGLFRPMFMTIAHHFWNGICGQSRSLGNLVKCIIDQENGLEEGFTIHGKEVVRAMLKDEFEENGRQLPPIWIDIKHMSRKSRLEYFELRNEFPNKFIPIIASHGGVTGLSAPGGTCATSVAQRDLFMTDSINFYDDELLMIESSGGILGIQLDERRIGSKRALRKARGHLLRRKILYSWAKLVWNQVSHMAEVLDMNGRFAWGIQSIGTDFDGVIDPINGYWTSKELDSLDDYLLIHAHNYLTGKDYPCPLSQARNKSISAEDIVERVMTSNALSLIAKGLN